MRTIIHVLSFGAIMAGGLILSGPVAAIPPPSEQECCPIEVDDNGGWNGVCCGNSCGYTDGGGCWAN